MATTMNVSLTRDLADFVSEAIESGGYNNQSEVARAALRLLRERDSKRRALLAAIDAGLADVKAGRSKPLTRKLLRDIADGARKRAAKPKPGRG